MASEFMTNATDARISPYNACSTVRWNDGVSFPIQSGHGCLGCSEDGFWDYGSFYSRATGIPQTGIEATADKIGLGVAGVAGAAAIAHATVSAIKHARNKNNTSSENAPEEKLASKGICAAK